MSNISDYTSLIRHWSGILSRRQSLISILFKDKKLLSIVQSYIDGKAKQVIDESFNIFEIISDRYYLENFHSNLIAFFLSPNSNHHYGKTGLKLFFDLLNNIRPGCISYFNYSYAEISTEAPLPGGRIDILIKDEISKHAVVIENKINNASDMPRQIPRYCDFLEKEGFTIDVVVYLPLYRFSSPDRSTWKKDDYRWNNKIIVLPANAENGFPSLTKGWLKPLSENSINNDCASILKQYANLITKLSNKNMDKVTLDKLYDYLLEDNNLETANSFVSMMNEFPQYLAQRIFDVYSERCSPFAKIWIYKDLDAVFEQCYIDTIYFKMDIWCNTRNYTIYFWCPQTDDYSKLSGKDIKEFLQSKGITVFDDFSIKDKMNLVKDIPISTPLNQIVAPILKQLSEIADK